MLLKDLTYSKGRALALAAVLSAAGIASAQTQFFTSYDVNMTKDFAVSNIMMLESFQNHGAATWAFGVGGIGVTTLNNPFASDEPCQMSLLIGLAHDLPGDAEGQKHMVIMMDPLAAQLSNHIAWGTLFRNTREEDLIANLELATSGQDWPIIQPGLDGVGAWANGDAQTGILGPGGVVQTAWFSTTGAFTVVAFSDGDIVGDGQGHVTAVPEPASMAVMGVGVLALLRRRNKRS